MRNGLFVENKYDTRIARSIRVLAEVEKLWILKEINNDDALNYDQFEDYIMHNNIPGFKLSKDQILEVFHKMDKNSDLSIDKNEMYFFLTAVLNLNHQSSIYLKLVDKICIDMSSLQ